jgi:hypothetical protein
MNATTTQNLYAIKHGFTYVDGIFSNPPTARAATVQDAYRWNDEAAAKRIARELPNHASVVPVIETAPGVYTEGKEIYAYKNTASSAGSPKRYIIDPKAVWHVRVWFNMYGNPSYGFHMSDGTTYLLIDDYGAMNGLNHLSRHDVYRKKDLI